MPKIDIANAPVTRGSGYPEPYAAEFAERLRVRLGDSIGLSSFGVNLTTLQPGARSSLRHWHEVEEEMVVVMSGEVVLIEEDGEALLGPGDAAGFPAGEPNGHCIENRSDAPATILEIGPRPASDRCHYADVDLICVSDDSGDRFIRRDGSPVS